jgi:hypothetical protein
VISEALHDEKQIPSPQGRSSGIDLLRDVSCRSRDGLTHTIRLELLRIVPAVGISWADASAAASASSFLGLSGHLATVTSAAENNFLAGSFDFTAFEDLLAIAWLGGQVSSSGIGTWTVGPDASLNFSSGGAALPGRYANWGGIEPNNAPSAVEMQVGTLDWFGITHGKWADARNGLSCPCPDICDPIVGYFVEFESPAAVPLSPSVAQFIIGLALLGWLAWWKNRMVTRKSPNSMDGTRAYLGETT